MRRKKRQYVLEKMGDLRDDIRTTRTHLMPQLDRFRADIGDLVNFFEAKFTELEFKIKTISEEAFAEEPKKTKAKKTKQ